MRSQLLFLVAFSGCASLAVSMAPQKKLKVDDREVAQATTAEFWKVFHAGQYDAIGPLLEKHKQVYLTHPYDASIAAHTGFLHLWRIAESARNPQLSAAITDDMSMARVYFHNAVQLEPKWALVRGFWASTVLAEGAIHKNEGQLREGYFALEDAVDLWPELNLFTKAIMLAQSKYDSPQYTEAVEAFWKNVEVCADGKPDRKNPDLSKAARPDPNDPKKAICANTWKAPFNFEGAMLVFGDLLVKQGEVESAKKVYASAKQSATYAQWPYRALLEARLANAAANVEPFRVEPREQPALDKKFVTGSAFTCTVCHQKDGIAL
jgi:tetratricopeptide (TPR) repeat protein